MSAAVVTTGLAVRHGERPSARSSLARPLVVVEDLEIQFSGAASGAAVSGVSLEVRPGECLAVVGESGSGKSMLLQSLLGVVRGAPGVVRGRITYELPRGGRHEPLLGLERAVSWAPSSGGRARRALAVSERWRAASERRFARLRGGAVGLVLQNGRAALEPMRTIGAQVAEALRTVGRTVERGDLDPEVLAWLERVGLRDPPRVARSYAHELSGGMAQRAMLASVLARAPELLLLDEMTTGLDVSVQAQLVDLIATLKEQQGFGAIVVTHDLGVAARLAERVLVMRRGELVHRGPVDALASGVVPRAPYVAELVRAASGVRAQGPVPEPPSRPALIEVSELWKRYRGRARLFGRSRRDEGSVAALAGVSFSIGRGECVAIVGESGSGKTTLARILVTLLGADQGRVAFDGVDVARARGAQLRALRRRCQILFQNPYTSLNPEQTPRAAIEESLRLHQGLAGPEASEEALRLLTAAGLRATADRRLARMSGGERRRVGLLQTMSSDAELVVLDEPSSGLDAVHRTEVIRMITAERARSPDRTFVVISHDLGFVTGVADRVLVLRHGLLVEELSVRGLELGEARHPYTRELVAAAESLSLTRADRRTTGAPREGASS